MKTDGVLYLGPKAPELAFALWSVLIPAFFLLRRKALFWSTALLAIAWAGLATFDLWYFRFFRDLPSLHLLATWKQGGRASESLASVTDSSDLILWLPVLLYLVCSYVLTKRAQGDDPEQKLRLGLLLLGALAGSLLFANRSDVQREQLQRRFQNRSIGSIFGLTVYHTYDAWEYARVRLGAEGGSRLELDLVASVIEKSRQRIDEPSPMAGRFTGRNLIIVQLESLEWFALNAEVEGRPVMPFLRKAATRGVAFRLLDQTHLGRSADGQFLFLQGLHPPSGRPLPFTYPNLTYVGLPRLFLESGYSTYYFHPSFPSFWNAETLATNYGFKNRWFRQDLPPEDPDRDLRGWGLTDAALFGRVMEHLESADQPFMSYVVTVMCHHPYRELKPDDVDFPPVKPDSMLNDYLRLCHLRDRSLSKFVHELGQRDWGRKTVLVLVGDHDAQLPASELLEAGYPSFPQNETVPAILVAVDALVASDSGLDEVGSVPISGAVPAAGQIDLPPTLAHVFSLAMEETLFVGWNLFSTDERDPVVSRLGTTMDREGWIQSLEGLPLGDGRIEFEVSEMLLHDGDLERSRRQLGGEN